MLISKNRYEQIRKVFSNGCVLSYFRPKTVLTFGTTILDGEKKADILEEIYSLGFRGLHALFEDIEEYLEAIQQEIDNLIEKKGASTKVDKAKIANKLISEFMEIIAFVFVKRISDSVASKNLFPTTNKVMERN